MNTILDIPFTLNHEEIKSQLAIYPGSMSEASIEKIFVAVEKIARPKAIYRVSYIRNTGDDTVTVQDTVFHSAAMRRNLEEVGRIFPFIATCGTEMENTPIEPGRCYPGILAEMIKLAPAAVRVWKPCAIPFRTSTGLKGFRR